MGGTMTKPSGFAAALNAAAIKKGPSCSVGVALANMNPTDCADAGAGLADRSIPHRQLAAAFKALGHNVGDGAVSRHRYQQCQCDQ